MKMKTFNALRSNKMKRYQIHLLQLYQQRRMSRKGNFHRLAISVDQDVVEKPNGPSCKQVKFSSIFTRDKQASRLVPHEKKWGTTRSLGWKAKSLWKQMVGMFMLLLRLKDLKILVIAMNC